MFEAAHAERTRAPAEAIWPLWGDPGRWAEIDDRIERVEADGELSRGAELRVKLRKGGTTRQRVVEIEPDRLLTTETRLPGGTLGHERRLAPAGDGAEITHRLYVSGPLWPFWALMLGRRRLRDSVELFARRERDLVEPTLPRRPRKRRS